ncbi:MAG: YgjV family protein [Butyrivibrio sp.]|nr:YgjV family protein [Butyrivibrio sp.]
MNQDTIKIIIEAVGYLGSAIVLVSFLMVSVVKLRIVNSIGSIIFTIYAFIIKSYPTAIMNLCLVGINIYHLVKMSNTGKNSPVYDLVKVSPKDALLKYVVANYSEDIKKFFPDAKLDFEDSNAGYVVCHNGKPAGVLVGKFDENGTFDIALDYSIPEYRDFSIAGFLFSKLPEEGVKSLIFRGVDTHHKEYLLKNNFVKKDDYYQKTY